MTKIQELQEQITKLQKELAVETERVRRIIIEENSLKWKHFERAMVECTDGTSYWDEIWIIFYNNKKYAPKPYVTQTETDELLELQEQGVIAIVF